AKQSRRAGVMRIDEATKLTDLLPTPALRWAGVASPESPESRVAPESRESSEAANAPAWFFTTRPDAQRVASAAEAFPAGAPPLLVLIGPEGGWSDDEEQLLRDAGLTPLTLGTTILRIETAAVAAAAVVAALLGGHPHPAS